MEISLPGLIGAFMGSVVGVMDFGIVAGLLRRAWEKNPGDAGVTARRELILKVAFAVNLVVFAGLGWWFGTAMTGLSGAN